MVENDVVIAVEAAVSRLIRNGLFAQLGQKPAVVFMTLVAHTDYTTLEVDVDFADLATQLGLSRRAVALGVAEVVEQGFFDFVDAEPGRLRLILERFFEA